MALVLYDRVQQTGSANTTVSFTLSGSVAGYQSFAVVGNGNTTYYGAVDSSGNWEAGIGTYSTSGPTLTRTTILASSNSGSAVSTFSGSINIFVTYPAEKSVNRDANGNVNISYTPNVATNIGALNVGDGTYSTSATGQIASFASADATYANVILQNTNNTSSSAYSSYVTAANNYPNQYMEIGSNSTNYNATAAGFVMNSLNAAGANFVQSYGSDLVLATWTSNNIHFLQNATSATTDSMTLYADGGASLGGLGDPGIGNIAINNAVVGLTTITASTTAVSLTSSSTQVQAVSGSTTQRINLPQATTLLKGTFYTVANTSTGNVSVYDNAGTLLETITTGGAAQFLCVSNATSAGTWGVRVFASSNTQWGNSTLTYPGTIASATWNGTTIGTGYGGTGLTTFSSSNYAIYSTSPSALTAGTLPVLAGGTGTTTSTGSGSTVLSASPNLTTPNLGVATATSISLASSAGTSSNTSNLNLGGTLGFSDTGILANFVSTTNSYNQVVVQNLSNGASASSEFIAYSNAGSASTNFATVGINSTGYTGTGSINAPGYGYFLTGSTDIAIGTIGSNNIHLVTNSQATDAITITPNNAVGFNGSYGSSGYVLQSNGASAAPVWVAPSGSSILATTDFTATSGQTTFSVTYTPALLQGVYRNGIKLGLSDYTATNGTSIVLNTGAITGDLIEVQYFSALATTTTVTSFSGGSTGLTPSSATSGAVTLAGTLGVGNGGTGVTSSTGSGSNVLNTSPTLVTPILGVASATSLTLGSALTVANGGTGITTTPSNGQIPIGNGTNYTAATLTAGTAISITNASGSVTIAGATSGVTAGSYTTANITVDAQGRVISASSGSGGSTVTPTTTNATYYIVGSSATSGTLTAYISNTNAVSYNASTGALTAVSHVSSSDERLKQDIETIAGALTKVETMRGVTYLRNGIREIGVVAQEVERVVPEVVHTEDGEYGYKSVSYGNMVGLLIEAVKELSAEVKELKAKLNDTSE